MLWLRWWVVGSVVGWLGRKPFFSLGFSRFLGGQAPYEPNPRLLAFLASRPVFFEVKALKPEKAIDFVVFLEVGFSTSP